MTKLFWKSLVVTPVILGTALFASSASAQELSDAETLSQINEYTSVESDMGQLRSVNQLSDVRPTDWAYQAVRSLVERYNCVAGYPDGTFRGSRAMTRYEAAALVNACMDTVNDLIAAATADLVTKDDLAVLQRLQEEFQAELATLRGRVDSLEARTAELEANQFSTTTRLGGGAIFSLNGAVGDTDLETFDVTAFTTAFNNSFVTDGTLNGNGIDAVLLGLESTAVDRNFAGNPSNALIVAADQGFGNGNGVVDGTELADLRTALDATDLAGLVGFGLDEATIAAALGATPADDRSDDNTVFGGRVRLNFDTSFTGEDLLRTRLEAENIKNASQFSTGALEYSGGSGTVDGGGGSEVSFVLDSFWYRFPVGEKAEVTVGPIGVGINAFVPTAVWGGGFISDYFDGGGAAPYETSADEAGIGGNYQLNEYFNVAAGYVVDNGADDPSAGIFEDTYSAMAQLTGTTGNFTGALLYTHSYDDDGTLFDGVGTSISDAPFLGLPSTAHTVSVLMAYQFSPKFILQGFVGHSWADLESKYVSADAKALTAGLGFVFPDALIEGNEAGIAVGLPPFVYDHSIDGLENASTPIAVDMYYDFRVSDNIFIAPSALLLFNANGGGTDFYSTENDSFEAVGAIKTRFRF